MQQEKYFAAAESEDAVKELSDKANSWFNEVNRNGYLEKLRDCLRAYHGAYFGDDGHEILFSGEQGELVRLAVNHFRNIAQHILGMVTATRPAFQARSVNTDYKSLVQTTLANNLLEYYMREKRLERYLKLAVEYAIVLGAGFVKMEWNSMRGEEYDFNEELGVPVYQGDVEFSNLSPFDVVFDSTKESANDEDWVITRSWKNRFDVAAKYPEQEDEILSIKTKSDLERYSLIGASFEKTDDIPVYEFFHKRTESMPDGRYLLYLDENTVLLDSPMPYRSLPVYRISASDILGTPYGYTAMFDLLPIQDAINSLYSTVLTNQTAFGVQNVFSFRGADITLNSLSGGLNFIEGNHLNVPGGGVPVPLNLTNTPGEIFNFIQMLEKLMETISGINSVARGNPESGVTAGNALALLQSQALQFISGLQQSYIFLVEDVGTGLIEMLQDFAAAPRVAAIVGKTNKTEMKEFTGGDIDSISRVIVDVGNALSQTTAGRLQIADNLLQMGAIKTVEQYFMVMNTGRIENMTEGVTNSVLLVRSENERLADNSTNIIALATDNHALHIQEHASVLADPDLRLDQELVARVLSHIQEHITLQRETDPDLLAMLGQQALGPEGGTPLSPQQPGNQAPGNMPPGNPQASGVQADGGPSVVASPASPPPINDPRPMA